MSTYPDLATRQQIAEAEAQYFSTPPEERETWKCTGCGRNHPQWHDECYWCRPTGYGKDRLKGK